MIDEAVKDRERQFHDERFGAALDPRSHLDKYYSVTDQAKFLYRETIRRSSLKGGRLLEYGCGTGEELSFYKGLNREFFGIDISSEAIRRATEIAKAADFQAKYLVADAEQTDFDPAFFGTIFGSGILHHLDVDKAARELSRLTSADGECVFFEPMGHNPLINLFRAMTPKLRTPDEHPLLAGDFEIMRRYFADVHVTYFCLTSLLAVPFRGTSLFAKLNRSLSTLDESLFQRSEAIARWSWICVIRMSKPFPAGMG